MAQAGTDGEQAIRPEDIERILEAMGQGEADTLREALRRAMGPVKPVERDW